MHDNSVRVLRGRFIGVVGLVALVDTSAFAAPTTTPTPTDAARRGVPRRFVRFVYEAAPGAEACPGGEEVRAGVRGRLTYDPFDEAAENTIEVVFTRAGKKLLVRVKMRSPDGHVGVKEIASNGKDCSELASAAELAIVVAIDPFMRDRPSSPTVEESREEPRPPEVPSPPEALARSVEPRPLARGRSTPRAGPVLAADAPRTQAAISFGALASVGVVPSVTGGLFAGARVRRDMFSLSLEVQRLLPASVEREPRGGIRVSLARVVVAPCVVSATPSDGSVFLCVTASAGAVRGVAYGVRQALAQTAPHLTAGAQAGIEFALPRPFRLRAQVGVETPLAPTNFKVNDVTVWEASWIGASAAIALSADFL